MQQHQNSANPSISSSSQTCQPAHRAQQNSQISSSSNEYCSHGNNVNKLNNNCASVVAGQFVAHAYLQQQQPEEFGPPPPPPLRRNISSQYQQQQQQEHVVQFSQHPPSLPPLPPHPSLSFHLQHPSSNKGVAVAAPTHPVALHHHQQQQKQRHLHQQINFNNSLQHYQLSHLYNNNHDHPNHNYFQHHRYAPIIGVNHGSSNAKIPAGVAPLHHFSASSSYQLSDDIRAKELSILEKKYGGRLAANRAARIIQRSWRQHRLAVGYAKIKVEKRISRKLNFHQLSLGGGALQNHSQGLDIERARCCTGTEELDSQLHHNDIEELKYDDDEEDQKLLRMMTEPSQEDLELDETVKCISGEHLYDIVTESKEDEMNARDDDDANNDCARNDNDESEDHLQKMSPKSKLNAYTSHQMDDFIIAAGANKDIASANLRRPSAPAAHSSSLSNSHESATCIHQNKNCPQNLVVMQSVGNSPLSCSPPSCTVSPLSVSASAPKSTPTSSSSSFAVCSLSNVSVNQAKCSCIQCDTHSNNNKPQPIKCKLVASQIPAVSLVSSSTLVAATNLVDPSHLPNPQPTDFCFPPQQIQSIPASVYSITNSTPTNNNTTSCCSAHSSSCCQHHTGGRSGSITGYPAISMYQTHASSINQHRVAPNYAACCAEQSCCHQLNRTAQHHAHEIYQMTASQYQQHQQKHQRQHHQHYQQQYTQHQHSSVVADHQNGPIQTQNYAIGPVHKPHRHHHHQQQLQLKHSHNAPHHQCYAHACHQVGYPAQPTQQFHHHHQHYHHSNNSSSDSHSFAHRSHHHPQQQRQIQALDKKRKRLYRICLNFFNKNPVHGISLLIKMCFVEQNASQIARFLFMRKGLSRQAIGIYFGQISNQLAREVVRKYLKLIEISELDVDEALRKVLSNFQIAGESQKIGELMTEFKNEYVAQNSSRVQKLFRDEDTVMLLSYAIIMLHTDRFNSNIRAKSKMSKDAFIHNLRKTDDNEDIDRGLLSDIYDRVTANEWKTLEDHTDIVRKINAQLCGPLKPTDLIQPFRRLVCYCKLFEVPLADAESALSSSSSSGGAAPNGGGNAAQSDSKFSSSRKHSNSISLSSSNSGNSSNSMQHIREVFLFNDMLLVTKPMGGVTGKSAGKDANISNNSSTAEKSSSGSSKKKAKASSSSSSDAKCNNQCRHEIQLYGLQIRKFSTPAIPHGIQFFKSSSHSNNTNASKISLNSTATLKPASTSTNQKSSSTGSSHGGMILALNTQSAKDRDGFVDDLLDCIMEVHEMDAIRLEEELAKQNGSNGSASSSSASSSNGAASSMAGSNSGSANGNNKNNHHSQNVAGDIGGTTSLPTGPPPALSSSEKLEYRRRNSSASSSSTHYNLQNAASALAASGSVQGTATVTATHKHFHMSLPRQQTFNSGSTQNPITPPTIDASYSNASTIATKSNDSSSKAEAILEESTNQTPIPPRRQDSFQTDSSCGGSGGSGGDTAPSDQYACTITPSVGRTAPQFHRSFSNGHNSGHPLPLPLPHPSAAAIAMSNQTASISSKLSAQQTRTTRIGATGLPDGCDAQRDSGVSGLQVDVDSQ